MKRKISDVLGKPPMGELDQQTLDIVNQYMSWIVEVSITSVDSV